MEETQSLLERGQREGQGCSSSSSSSSSSHGRRHVTSAPSGGCACKSPLVALLSLGGVALLGLLLVSSGIAESNSVQYLVSLASPNGAYSTSTTASGAEEEEEAMQGTDDWLGELGIDEEVFDVDVEDNDVDATSTGRTFSLKREGYALLDFFAKTPVSALTYSFFGDHTAVVEPYTKTQLVVFDDSSSTGYDATSNFRYVACPMGGSTDQCEYGVSAPSEPTLSSTITFECSSYDTYEITVSKFTSDWAATGEEMTGTAVCMYVRREIRDLTTADLDKTMDAMYALWSTSQEDGEKTYGKMFKNSTYFAAAHDFNAAWQDADHIHEGLGFVPQHIKITNIFEVSMQAVDRSVTLPYWDFTLDYAKNLTIFESPVFTSQTFGTLAQPADHYWGWTYTNDRIEDAVITDGRWQSTLADINYAYPDLQNGFGYIRGPWNMNPSKYVVRFPSYTLDLPSCLDYFAWGSDSDYLDFLAMAAYGPHASTHGVVGGVFGCDLMDPLLADGIIRDAESQLSICKKWGFYLKELYRANYIAPRTDCSATSLAKDDIDCGFTCIAASYDSMLSELPSVISSQYVPANIDDAGWQKWRDFICEGDASLVFVGDHLESASPSDPSFWPIHPTQERLLQAKYISGGWQDLSWPSDAQKDYVCDKSECYESDYGSKDSYSECCYGHYENDQLLDFETGDKTKGIGPTNKQTMDDTNPASMAYAMPYIYQHFQWDHCDEDFESMLTAGLNGLSGSAAGAAGAANDPSASTLSSASTASARGSKKSGGSNKAKKSKKSMKRSEKKSGKR